MFGAFFDKRNRVIFSGRMLTMRYGYISSLIVVAGLWFGANPATASTVTIAPGVTVVYGSVNGVVAAHNGRTLLIYGDPSGQTKNADTVLFTHHRRDGVWPGLRYANEGAKAVIPAAEQDLFTKPNEFWEAWFTKRLRDSSMQTTKVLTQPIPNASPVKEGDTIEWEGLSFRVYDTPGFTRGAVSYVFEKEGVLIACIGDLMYGDGKIFDLYSMQDAMKGTNAGGYHGYMARVEFLIQSLEKIARLQPDVLIPARGEVVTQPQAAIKTLIKNLRDLYENYLSICALRWYWGDDYILACVKRVLGKEQIDWMPMAESVQPEKPAWLLSKGTTRLLVSKTGNAFMLDCGGQSAIDFVTDLQKTGVIQKVEGIFVTHYHYDHTDGVEMAARQFQCPVYCSPILEDILRYPERYRMPVETDAPISEVRVMNEGEAMSWHEFTLTGYDYPGQTLYHGALLAKPQNEPGIFFVGDSFTPAGIDDYCLLNRNFLHPQKGYLYCIEMLRGLEPETHIVNQHVEEPFRFSVAQLDRMKETLIKRRALLAKLVPFDEPNFGIDERWAELYPYGQTVKAGDVIELQARFTNHAPRAQSFTIHPHLPQGWVLQTDRLSIEIEAGQEGILPLPILVQRNQGDGITVLTADIQMGERTFVSWVEAMIKTGL
jgi:glyoxylase-like metal-dependent hydrolase (beta-lactamase superfamily II)